LKYNSIIFVFVLLFALVSAYTISFAQTNWNRSQNPVLEPGDPGEWDDGLIASPSILFDGTTYHMWYVGGHDQTLLNIGYAFSFDGISWKKDTLNNPVLGVGASGSWEETWVYFPTVIYDYDSSIFHMWYAGTQGNPVTMQNWAERIGHATSPNGYDWKKDTLNPVLELGQAGSWEDYLVSTPFVRFDGALYHMCYTGSRDDGNFKIGHATSPSPYGKMWTKDALNPVMSGSSGSWDYPRVQDPRVLFDGTIYHLWYSGGGFFTWQIGHATSSDGITWAKDTANNPVLPRGIAGSWDDQFVTSCSVILDTSAGDSIYIYKMWYGGGNANWDSHIGYADAPVGIKLLDMNLLNDYVLHQNYPNPFNPTTTIEFSIPKSEFVTLKVYNILGEEVATLVSEKLTAGKYKYDWDAGRLASGVYLYRIQVGDFVEAKKMILMR
jgi:hypothetical protein